jgi:hypothetical protein
MSNKSNCIYIIESGDSYVKIGITKNPSTRIKSIAYETSLKVTNERIYATNVSTRSIEKSIHKSLNGLGVFGEWFNIPFDIAVDKVISSLNDIENCEYKNVTKKQRPLDGDYSKGMREIDSSELRGNASNWNGGFIVNKMKQGRDKIVDKTFVVMEVPAVVDGEAAIDYAIAYLKNRKEGVSK